MKTLPALFSGIMLALIIFLTGPTKAGSTIIDQSLFLNNEISDSWRNFHIIDLGKPFNAGGILKRWEIIANNENLVQLVIYRREGDKFIVVGRSEIETPQEGYNQFELRNKLIDVKAGDFVGMYYPDQSSVSYSEDNNGTTLLTNSDAGGSNDAATSFTHITNRHYAIRAIGGLKIFN